MCRLDILGIIAFLKCVNLIGFSLSRNESTFFSSKFILFDLVETRLT